MDAILESYSHAVNSDQQGFAVIRLELIANPRLF